MLYLSRIFQESKILKYDKVISEDVFIYLLLEKAKIYGNYLFEFQKLDLTAVVLKVVPD